MPAIPLVYWFGAGAAAALGFGGYSLGNEIGKGVGKSVPIVTMALIGLVTYQALRK